MAVKKKKVVIGGNETISDFDMKIRTAFNYDIWDHCSVFSEDDSFQSQNIGGILPDGEGSDIKIKDIGITPGVSMSYVYDLGDDILHIVTLDDIC